MALTPFNDPPFMQNNPGNFSETSSVEAGLTNGSPAFTLTELVVVVGVIVLLAATLLPALAQSKLKPQAVVCLSNMRQLQRAALLYASDNNDSCPGNSPLSPQGNAGAVGGPPDWVYSTMGWAGNPDMPAGCSTNPFYLGVNGTTGFGVTLNGSIGPYVKSAAAYHCPADHYIDPAYHVLRVRSCSANMYIGAGMGLIAYKSFQRYSQFGAALSPSECFQFLDENQLSLNDGSFDYSPDGQTINDRPAVYHCRGTSFSFADGHADLHQWQDVFLEYHIGYPPYYGGVDTLWLAQHGTYKTQ